MTRATPALKAARRCYGHLAGEAGVKLREALEAAGHLRLHDDAYRLTESGRRWAEALGLDTDDRDAARHARACLDWTERQPHIGGRLGRSLLDLLLARNALVAGDGRILHPAWPQHAATDGNVAALIAEVLAQASAQGL